MRQQITRLVSIGLGILVLIGSAQASQLWQGSRSIPRIALTFDDGPKPEKSKPLLAILDQYGVRATFFVVGQSVTDYPDMVLRLADSGHELANHSFSHRRLTTLSKREIQNELDQTNTLIESITHQPVRFFRPPGGRYNATVLSEAKKRGLIMAMWDVNAGDYTPHSDMITIQTKDQALMANTALITSILNQAQNGSIILFHNGGAQTTAILPAIILGLQSAGFELVTLSELISDSPPKTSRFTPSQSWVTVP